VVLENGDLLVAIAGPRGAFGCLRDTTGVMAKPISCARSASGRDGIAVIGQAELSYLLNFTEKRKNTTIKRRIRAV